MKVLIEPKKATTKKEAKTIELNVDNPTPPKTKDNSQLVWLVILIIVAIGTFMVWNYYKKNQQKTAESL